jgi:hypothetical protein
VHGAVHAQGGDHRLLARHFPAPHLVQALDQRVTRVVFLDHLPENGSPVAAGAAGGRSFRSVEVCLLLRAVHQQPCVMAAEPWLQEGGSAVLGLALAAAAPRQWHTLPTRRIPPVLAR